MTVNGNKDQTIQWIDVINYECSKLHIFQEKNHTNWWCIIYSTSELFLIDKPVNEYK